MLYLLLDQFVPLLSALLGLVNISYATTRETCHVHLLAMKVAPVDRPLLPCNPEHGKGRYIMVPISLDFEPHGASHG
jgi:hypothetical protein